MDPSTTSPQPSPTPMATRIWDMHMRYYIPQTIFFPSTSVVIKRLCVFAQFVLADALVRYHRIFGYDTYFLTGSDEHGQKVAASAEKSGRTPIEHCDYYVNAFKALNQKLSISCSQYVRTTDPYHEQSAKVLNEAKYCNVLVDIFSLILNNY